MDAGGYTDPYTHEFSQQVEEERRRATQAFQRELQEEAQRAQRQFEERWKAYAQVQRRMLSQAAQSYRRQYLKAYGRHPRPKEVQTWRQTQTKALEDQLDLERQSQEMRFQDSLQSWREQNWQGFQQQFTTWETEQRGVFQAELQTWKAEVAATEKEWKDLKARWETMTVDQAMKGVEKHYATRKGEPGYSKYYDFNQDGIIDLHDLVIVSKQVTPQPSPEELAKYDVAAPFGIIDVADIAVLAKRGISKEELQRISKLYGTKYLEIPELEEGAVVTGVSYAGGEFILQYQIPSPEMPAETTGLAEYLVGIELPKPALRKWRERYDLGAWIFGEAAQPTYRPLAPVAGVVAAFEAPAYSIARLIGIEAPRPPPTFSGAAVGEFVSAVGSVLGYEIARPTFAWEQLDEYGRGYVEGTILGDIALSFMLGYVGGKAWGKIRVTAPVAKVSEAWKYSHLHYVLSQAKTRISTSIYAPIYRHTIFPVKSRLEKWLLPYPTIRGFGEVSIPEFGKETWYGVVRSPEQLITRREAVSGAWAFMQTPKTAGVFIRSPPITTTGLQTYIFEHAVTAAGVVTHRLRPARAEEFIMQPAKETWKYEVPEALGFERTPWRMESVGDFFFEKARWPTIAEMKERGLLPAVTQTQLTRLDILPSVPQLPMRLPVTERLAMPAAAWGLAALIGISAAPRREPTRKEIARVKRAPVPAADLRSLIFAGFEPTARERERAGLEPASVTAQIFETTPTYSQMFQPPGAPGLITPAVPGVPPRERKRKKKRKKKPKPRELKWLRYEIIYPVKGVSEVAKHILS
jgi:hypothetical protein